MATVDEPSATVRGGALGHRFLDGVELIGDILAVAISAAIQAIRDLLQPNRLQCTK